MKTAKNYLSDIISKILSECDTTSIGIGETGTTVQSDDIYAPGDSRKPVLLGAGTVPGKKKKKNQNNTFPPIIKRNP